MIDIGGRATKYGQPALSGFYIRPCLVFFFFINPLPIPFPFRAASGHPAWLRGGTVLSSSLMCPAANKLLFFRDDVVVSLVSSGRLPKLHLHKKAHLCTISEASGSAFASGPDPSLKATRLCHAISPYPLFVQSSPTLSADPDGPGHTFRSPSVFMFMDNCGAKSFTNTTMHSIEDCRPDVATTSASLPPAPIVKNKCFCHTPSLPSATPVRSVLGRSPARGVVC